MRRETADRRSAAARVWLRRRGCHRYRSRPLVGSRQWRGHERSPTYAAGYGSSGPARSSVRPCIVDVEVVEAARRTVAAEGADIQCALEAGSGEQPAELRAVVIAQRLYDAVRAQALHAAAHVKMRLVDRVAERLAGIAEDHQRAGL